MAITNKKPKEEIKAVIDEVLEETPPGTPAEPEVKVEDLLAKDPSTLTAEEMDVLDEHKDDLTDEQKIAVGLMDPENVPTPSPEVPPGTPSEPVIEPSRPVEQPKEEPVVVPPVIIPDVAEPTEEELNAYIKTQGVDPDELTNWEKIQARKTMIAERKLEAIDKGSQSQKALIEWNKKVDTFLGSTNDDPKYARLGGHEEEFRRFASQHLDSDIENLLLPAFLHNLPAEQPKKTNLFERGGGGQPPQKPKEGIDDADLAKNLRETNPREYRRQLRAGKIKIEVD